MSKTHELWIITQVFRTTCRKGRRRYATSSARYCNTPRTQLDKCTHQYRRGAIFGTPVSPSDAVNTQYVLTCCGDQTLYTYISTIPRLNYLTPQLSHTSAIPHLSYPTPQLSHTSAIPHLSYPNHFTESASITTGANDSSPIHHTISHHMRIQYKHLFNYISTTSISTRSTTPLFSTITITRNQVPYLQKIPITTLPPHIKKPCKTLLSTQNQR
jgi:hypothetical protein